MRAVRRALLAALLAVAAALALAVGGPAASGTTGVLPAAIQSTSYPWVQPPPGTGVTGPQGKVAQQICAPVQLPCTIPLQ